MLKSLLEDCVGGDVSLCALLMFCNPGNTVHEAMKLMEHFNMYITGREANNEKRRGEVKMPASWNLPADEIKSNYIF